MKKKILFLVLTLFVQLISFSQNSSSIPAKEMDFKESISGILRKFDTKALKEFDVAVAVKKAMERSSVKEIQMEYFEHLVRQFVNSKLAPQVSVHGKQPFTSDYDASSKTLQVNLTPYNSYCANAGFENGNFGGWDGDTWTLSGTDWLTSPVWNAGIETMGTNTPVQPAYNTFGATSWRHTVMTVPPTINNPPANCIGWDSIAINPVTHKSDIPFVPPTSNGVTCRLGNANTGSETERIRYTMSVSAQNSQFNFSYAIVFQNPSGHTATEQPFFQINVYDQAGNPINNCGTCQANAFVASSDSSFHAASVWDSFSSTWIDPSNTSWQSYALYYKKWTLGTIDLTPYIGQNITFEFRTADCSQGGHFGYGYIDASCQPKQASISNCSSSGTTFCVAPTGYASYQWYGPNNMNIISGETNDTLVLSNPNMGDVYTVVAVPSACGCSATMSVTIQNTSVGVLSTSSISSCINGSSGSAGVVATGSSNGYSYSWTDSSGSVVGNSPFITNLAPGTYSVHISSAICGFYDTTVVVAISPPVVSQTIQSLCGNQFVINAPAGSNYIWYDATLNQLPGYNGLNQITVANNGNTNYTVVYNSASGCRDSLKIDVVEQINNTTQNVSFCGSSVSLHVPPGAANIIWYDANWPYNIIGNDTAITINNPVVSTFDPYYVIYTNPTTFCKDSIQFFLNTNASSVFASNILTGCPGTNLNGQATINLQTNAPAPYNYSITGPGGYNQVYSNSSNTSISLSNLSPGTYLVHVSLGSYCDAIDTFIVPNYISPFTLVYDTNMICGHDSSHLQLIPSNTPSAFCQLSANAGTNTGFKQVGNGTMQNTSTTNPSPYGNWYSNEKYQILYSATDLLAAGITAGGISSVGFDVASIPNGMNTSFLNYTIKIGCTSQNDFDPTGIGFSIPFISGINQVAWGPQNYTVTTGWNTHDFSQPYAWDGISNIVIEICYDWLATSTYTDNAIVNQTITGYNSFLVFYSDGTVACTNNTSSAVYKQRPNTKFGTSMLSVNMADYTYQWLPVNGLSNSTTLNVSASPTIATTYTITAIPINGGCNYVDSVTITHHSPNMGMNVIVSAPSCGTLGSATINATGIPPFQYALDSMQIQTSNIFTGISANQNHVICITDSSGCNACTSFIIADSCDLVWPGDANDDLIADNIDMLAIGIGNGANGTARSPQSIAWTGFPSAIWNKTLLAGSNYKHIDCNGDNTISLADTTAVIQNYDLTRPASKPFVSSPQLYQSTLPPLKMVAIQDTLGTGETGTILLMLGDATINADNVYGIAFTVNFDPTVIDPSSFSIHTNGSWMGTSGNDLMAFALNDGSSGLIKGVVTRYNHMNKSGNGLIATLNYKTKTTYSGTQHVLFSFSNILAIDSVENQLLFNSFNDSIVAVDHTTGINEINSVKFFIYPNPADNSITIKTGSSNRNAVNSTYFLSDLTGRKILSGRLLSETTTVLVEELAAGVYLLQIGEKGGQTFRLIKK